MAFYSISNFWYDEGSGNVFLNITKDAELSYAVDPEYGVAYDTYEAQIYLDGGLSLIGKVRPDSLDGTIQGGNFGKMSSNPNEVAGEPLENAPE